jgi:hypothetical protein
LAGMAECDSGICMRARERIFEQIVASASNAGLKEAANKPAAVVEASPVLSFSSSTPERAMQQEGEGERPAEKPAAESLDLKERPPAFCSSAPPPPPPPPLGPPAHCAAAARGHQVPGSSALPGASACHSVVLVVQQQQQQQQQPPPLPTKEQGRSPPVGTSQVSQRRTSSAPVCFENGG